MKKLIAGGVLLSMLFSGCQSAPTNVAGDSQTKDQKQQSELSMKPDFSWNQQLAEDYLGQENLLQVSYSGPFYFGNFAGIDGFTRTYKEARDKRSDEILKVVDESIGYLNGLEGQLRTERNLLDWYYLKVSALNPSSREELWEKMDETNRLALLNYTKLTYLNTLQKDLAKLNKSSEWGFLAYQKYYLSIDLTQTYNQEIADLHGKLASLYRVLEKQNLPTYIQINQQLDQAMKPLADKENELVHKLAYNGASLAFQEKLLFTADYSYVSDLVANMEQEIPKLKQTVADYKGGKEEITQDMLDVLNEQIAQYEEFTVNLKNYLASVPKADLVSGKEFILPGTSGGTVSWIPVANAGVYDTMSWFGGKISSAASTTLDYGKAGVGAAWEGTKTVAGVAVDGAIGGVKLAGKGIGTVLDAGAAVVKTPMDLVNGMYYGNSAKDILKTMGSNYEGVYNNFMNGTQGSQVYSDTVKILDESDKLVGQAAEGMVKATIGEGVTSKTVGFAAKIASGFFTGLTKDAVTALNPNTSKTDTVVALFGVGLSLWGGSGSFLKGSQALKIGASKSLSGASKLLNVVNSLDAGAIKEGVKDLFKDGFKGMVKKVFSKQSGEMLLEGTKTVIQDTKQVLSENLKNGYEMIKENATKNIPDALSGLFQKKQMLSVFADVMGIGEGAGAGMANKALSFLNNVVGSMADDKIKSWVGSAANMLGISSKTQEEINDDQQKAILDQVKKSLLVQLEEENKDAIKQVAKEYQEAKTKDSSNPFWSWLIPNISAVSAGTYSAKIKVSMTQYGIATTGGGPVSFTVDDHDNIICTVSLSVSVSGSVQGMKVSGSGTSSSTSCSGTVNPENGEFKVTGNLKNSGTAFVSGYGASQSSSNSNNLSFTASGNMKDGMISGTAKISQYTFELSPA